MNPFKVERFLFTDVTFLANLCWSLMALLALLLFQRQTDLDSWRIVRRRWVAECGEDFFGFGCPYVVYRAAARSFVVGCG